MDSSDFFTTPQERRAMESYTLLSESGFNTLYSMEREGKRFVAKALRRECVGNPLYESLLRKEFEIGYSLDHPNICRTNQIEQHAELGSLIVMEWVDGRTLDKYIEEKLHTVQELQQIVCQLCDALAYAHKRQIIHRDIKPQNIIITYNGDNVKLLDFGLSDSDHHTTLKEPAGSRKYAAPELLKGESVDLRADIYSLGVVIDEMYVGRKSQRISRIVARATSYYPSSRYADAQSFAQAIVGRQIKVVYPIILSLLVLLALVAYLLYAINDTRGSLIPSAEVDRVSAEEFERRRELSNNFYREINDGYVSLMYDRVYKTSCATPEMPDFERLSRECIVQYERALDSMMGEIKHSSLVVAARRNITSHNGELFTIMRSSYPSQFWLNTERLFRQSTDSLSRELRRIVPPKLSSKFSSLSFDEQQTEQRRYEKALREYKRSTVKVWAVEYRKRHGLSPLDAELLRYYE